MWENSTSGGLFCSTISVHLICFVSFSKQKNALYKWKNHLNALARNKYAEQCRQLIFFAQWFSFDHLHSFEICFYSAFCFFRWRSFVYLFNAFSGKFFRIWFFQEKRHKTVVECHLKYCLSYLINREKKKLHFKQLEKMWKITSDNCVNHFNTFSSFCH